MSSLLIIDAWSASAHANTIILLLIRLCKSPSTDSATLLYCTVALFSSYPSSKSEEENTKSLTDLCRLLPSVYPKLPKSDRDLARASMAQAFRKLPPLDVKSLCIAVLKSAENAIPFDAYDVAQTIYLIQFAAAQQWDAMPVVQRPLWRRIWGSETQVERTIPNFGFGILEAAHEVGSIFGSAAAAGLM